MKYSFIFPLLISHFLLAQEMKLNNVGSSNNLNENCISGDCYDGIGVKSINDFIYFGEFIDGKANGVGVVYNDEELILSEYRNNKRFGLLARSSNGKNILSYSKSSQSTTSSNGQFVLSDYNSAKAVRFKNNRAVKKSTIKLNHEQVFLEDAGVIYSRKINNYLKINLLDHIQSRNKANYTENNLDLLYGFFQQKSDFDLIYHPFPYPGYETFIAISYLSDENTTLFYIGNIGINYTGKGIYVTVKENKILDISYQDKFDSSKENEKKWKIFSMHGDSEFFEYEISEKSYNDYYVSKITRINNNIKVPPLLVVENIKFNDDNNNNLIEANENSEISFDIMNKGSGPAYGVNVSVNDLSKTSGVVYDKNKYIGKLESQEEKKIIIPIKSLMSLETGISNFQISILERNGFGLNKISFKLETQKFIPPKLEVVDYQFISDSDKIERGGVTSLNFVLQNTGQGLAEDVNIRMKIPNNVFESDNKEFYTKRISPGDYEQFNFKFFTNNKYENNNLNIESIITERYNKFGSSKVMSIEIGEDVSKSIVFNPKVTVDRANLEIEKISLTSKVDKNIPTKDKIKNRYALIIGNEDYSSKQNSLSSEQNVEYAINDARIFKQYALKTLGINEKNIFYLEDATSARMKQEIDLITKILSKLGDKAELVVYYAGHGFPDEKTKIPYLIPVDVSVSNLSSAIKLNDFYNQLSSTKANKITVFLDACFTGGGRNKSLLSSRGVKVVAKPGSLKGNLLVFSASSGNQSSLPYRKEKHGMFTYHLLKKLKESKGNIPFGDLYEYLYDEVSIESLKVNRAEQDPAINFSKDVKEFWKKWSFQ